MHKTALAIAAVSLSCSVAHADATEDSRNLYDVVARSSAAFLQLLQEAGKDPTVVHAKLSREVTAPVTKAKSDWLELLGKSAAEYAVFMPCHEAAADLEGMTEKLQRFLKGNGDATLDDDADYFRKDFTRCEQALGLAPTFPEVAEQLTGEDDE